MSPSNRKRGVLTGALFGIAIFVLIVLTIFAFIMMPRGTPVAVKNLDHLFEIVENGDIILRLGNRFWSQIFRDISVEDRRFSHMGIVRIYDGQITVIHAEGTARPGEDFVREEPLADFLTPAVALGIYRFTKADGEKIANLALEYIGVPFDWQFDMQDESRIYCTELLYVILKRLTPAFELPTVYIERAGRNVIPLDAISRSEYFIEVYFHQ